MNSPATELNFSPSIAAIQKMDEELGNYIPTEDEPFMNERQLQFFRVKLEKWKADIIADSYNTISHLQTCLLYTSRCV